MGFGVWGLGFGVWGLGFWVSGFGFRVEGSELRVSGLGLGCRWCRVESLAGGELRVQVADDQGSQGYLAHKKQRPPRDLQ